MRFYTKTVLPFAVVACAVFAPFAVRAAEASAEADPAAKDELVYIEALVNANMPDLAESVIEAAKTKWPFLGPKLKVLEVQGDLRLGKFAEVQKLIDSLKAKDGNYWALRLSMADAYYARGKSAECAKIYKEFFAAVPNPGRDLIDFYVESGFRWAQMCVRDKKYGEAVAMYDGLLKRINERSEEERWCAVAQEYVDLLVKRAGEDNAVRNDYLNRANKVVDKLLWKNESYPLVFGKAVAMKAHIVMLQGNPAKAQTIVNNYMPQLSEIHKLLLEQDPHGRKGYLRLSPMPECRYLLANILWNTVQSESKKPKANEDLIKDSLLGAKVNGRRNGLGAYNHALNVFIKYPESTYAAAAGELSEKIENFIEKRYKKPVQKRITPAQMAKVRQMQFANANEDFRANDYAKAVKSYEEVLARFPEYEESLDALANLGECYIKLWQDEKDKDVKEFDRLAIDVIEGQIAERFVELRKGKFNRRAGELTLRFAAREHDVGALARSQELFDLYFKNFPDHYNASQMALSLAGQAFKAEDWKTAQHYYLMIANTYTNSQYYASALQSMSICCGKVGDGEGQEMWLRKFAEAATKPTEKVTARLSLALLQQKRGFAAFLDADATAEATNDTAVVEAKKLAAYKGVAGAIKDFRKTSNAITSFLDTDKTLGKELRDKLSLQREQAQFLEGESWQRLSWPTNKVALFRKQAVKAYETYLTTNPKGRYAAPILMKIATIYTADKNAEEAQKAFARLQKDFPESDEAKNSVPRLAKTLIEMGLRSQGVEEYRKMIAADGKYTAAQFMQAGDALLEAKSWDDAGAAYKKSVAILRNDKTIKEESTRRYIEARSMLGQAKALCGKKQWAEGRQALDEFKDKFGKSALIVDAYEMIISASSEQGRTEKDDELRRKHFNTAIDAIKKLRAYRKSQPEQDLLNLRSGDVLVKKMQAEESMNLGEQAKQTCGLAVVSFVGFLQAHEPNEEHPAKDMTPAQLDNLERCYATVLPLMVKLGKDQSEKVIEYANVYMELFPNGKNKTAVQSALQSAQADLPTNAAPAAEAAKPAEAPAAEKPAAAPAAEAAKPAADSAAAAAKPAAAPAAAEAAKPETK